MMVDREKERAYNRADPVDIPRINDASPGDDAAKEGGDEFPLLQEVPAQDDLLRVVLVILDGGGISSCITVRNGSRGLGWDGIWQRNGGGGFLHLPTAVYSKRRHSGGGGLYQDGVAPSDPASPWQIDLRRREAVSIGGRSSRSYPPPCLGELASGGAARFP
ncbi:hypothetical protein PR202_ga07540 [Eleusine coracana subsp. coracana]|uniref:Uncharacterized protein n=1 Tax=Eleusine coracana subsp. coracana TaxID=191504 RepID=A0AAV5BZI9_ELECO|nr:hypothetical protein PR202_ga07540 [Eleusine coracana subsp. coracana]